jgi:hypothetical protein
MLRLGEKWRPSVSVSSEGDYVARLRFVPIARDLFTNRHLIRIGSNEVVSDCEHTRVEGRQLSIALRLPAQSDGLIRHLAGGSKLNPDYEPRRENDMEVFL